MSTATTMTEKQPATSIPATSVATTTRQAFRHAMPVLCGIFKQKICGPYKHQICGVFQFFAELIRFTRRLFL